MGIERHFGDLGRIGPKPGSLPWAAPGWREEVEAWLDGVLAEKGLERTGPIEDARLKPWSALLKLPTNRGHVYFKAVPAGLEHEVAMTVRLSACFPVLLLPVLAADADRGWMLLPDGGEQFREAHVPNRGAVWLGLLRDYAGLQRAAVEFADELLDAGVPDRRLHLLPEMYGAVLAQAEKMTRLKSDPFRPAEMRALAALRPAVLALGERLDSFGLPATVQHDDLHDRNILISDGSVKIFDWGDACIGNPLFSLRDSLMSIAEWLGVDYRDEPAALEPYSEAYLEGWRHLTPMPSLLEAARLAMPLSIITRLLSWEVAVRNAPPLDREQDAPWVVDLQREVIDMMGRFDATPV